MSLTVQDGLLVVRDGKLGTGQECCCQTPPPPGGACCQFSVTPENLLFWPPGVELAPCEDVTQAQCEECLCRDNAALSEVECACEYLEAVTVPVLAALVDGFGNPVYQAGEMVYYHTCPPCGDGSSAYAHVSSDCQTEYFGPENAEFYYVTANNCITIKRLCSQDAADRPIVNCVDVEAATTDCMGNYVNFAVYHSGRCGTWNPAATCGVDDPCNPFP